MKMNDARKYWIALNQAPGMTPTVFYRIVEFFGDPGKVWNASPSELINCGNLTPAVRESILKLRDIEDGREEIKRAESAGAEILTLTDDGYPHLLKETPEPPPVLYIKGKLPPDDGWTVAIVGTRNCTGYGSDAAFRLASELAGKGYTIVSGLAKGVDSAGHKGALQAGGRTVAVFGTGIDTVYPPAHAGLASEIERSGALLSQFPIGVDVGKWFFPMRNAVISGLSRGVIVVEAGEKSGAMITANLADEQSREVFAVPGDINRSNARGPHWLIKHGAHLVESAEDVIAVLGSPKGQSELRLEEVPENHIHAKVLDIISERPAQFDEICALAGMRTSEVTSLLMMMEMKGLIRRLPGGLYARRLP